MAKTIKFNLICDDKPIRTIEDLQENFSIEDVLEYYKNGLLLRWLKVRGYEEEYKKVSELDISGDLDIVKNLIEIFNVETDEKKVEEGVYMLGFIEERKEQLKAYSESGFKQKNILDDYQKGYKRLVDGILDNPNDSPLIKANIAEMVNNYSWALELNHRKLFWSLKEKSILAVMCLLMNESTRDYFLPNNEEIDSDKELMYRTICTIIKESNYLDKLGDNLHEFAGVTDGYWKDLEPKDKKYMIISMEHRDYVRASGVQGGELSSDDISGKFVIIDGIDYKSNYASDKLLYMEV